jgi:hypothetical protein
MQKRTRERGRPVSSLLTTAVSVRGPVQDPKTCIPVGMRLQALGDTT